MTPTCFDELSKEDQLIELHDEAMRFLVDILASDHLVERAYKLDSEWSEAEGFPDSPIVEWASREGWSPNKEAMYKRWCEFNVLPTTEEHIKAINQLKKGIQ